MLSAVCSSYGLLILILKFISIRLKGLKYLQRSVISTGAYTFLSDQCLYWFIKLFNAIELSPVHFGEGAGLGGPWWIRNHVTFLPMVVQNMDFKLFCKELVIGWKFEGYVSPLAIGSSLTDSMALTLIQKYLIYSSSYSLSAVRVLAN
jgi:hypothetical protein